MADIMEENPKNIDLDALDRTDKAGNSSPDEPPEKMRNQEIENASPSGSEEKELGSPVSFTLVYGHKKIPVSFPLEETVENFRSKVQELTGVPPVMQKLICKGPAMKNGTRLEENKLKEGCRVMLIGSTIQEVIEVNKPVSAEEIKKTETRAGNSREPFSKQKMHAKTIDKGIPEDCLPGIKNIKESLPMEPLTGMRNKYNQKARLTFKLELDQLWIGTPERTEKIPMGQISSIVSEPIVGHEEYHIMGIQLGSTEQSRYWLYWVPAQYVDAIKRAVLN